MQKLNLLATTICIVILASVAISIYNFTIGATAQAVQSLATCLIFTLFLICTNTVKSIARDTTSIRITKDIRHD